MLSCGVQPFLSRSEFDPCGGVSELPSLLASEVGLFFTTCMKDSSLSFIRVAWLVGEGLAWEGVLLAG